MADIGGKKAPERTVCCESVNESFVKATECLKTEENGLIQNGFMPYKQLKY